MAKTTLAEMLTKRSCGLKHWDKAVALVGKQALIERALNIRDASPTTWGIGWNNFDWALCNAVIEVLNPKKDISQTYNANAVLTDEELKLVAEHCGYNLPYIQCWERQ